jgi:hypothetical protein
MVQQEIFLKYYKEYLLIIIYILKILSKKLFIAGILAAHDLIAKLFSGTSTIN